MKQRPARNTLLKCVFCLILAVFYSCAARAACDEDTIQTISADGDLIVLTSGESYDVDPGDASTVSSWIENEDVLVCDDTIINKDENGEKVSVARH